MCLPGLKGKHSNVGNFPIELHNLIQHLLATLPEEHDINAAERQGVLEFMGSWERGSVGHRRRARLAIASARRVLPLVERLISGSWSRELILLAQQILEGKQEPTQVSLLLMQRWSAWVDEDTKAVRDLLRLYRPVGSRTVEETLLTVDQVAHAAVQALVATLWDEADVETMLRKYPDTTIAYWRSFDAAAWAWLAEREKDAHHLQNGDAFWDWYLREAVPRAWASEVE